MNDKYRKNDVIGFHDDNDDEDEFDMNNSFDDEEDEECLEDTCSEEEYADVNNVGFLRKVAKTLSYFTNRN